MHRWNRHGVLVLLLLSLVLAGCAGSNAKSGATSPGARSVVTAGAFDSADSENTGEIVGRVVDDEFRPIGDVSIRVQGTPAETLTTQDGIFFFGNVPARAYTLLFSKAGYESKSQSIVVSAQQRAVAEALLTKAEDTSAFVDTGFTFNGRINCSVRGNVSGTNTNPECNAFNAEVDVNRMRSYDIAGGVRWVLIEVSWQASVPTLNEKLNLAIRPFEGPAWRQIQGASPIKVLLGPSEFSSLRNYSQKDYVRFGGQMQLAMFPGETLHQSGVGAGATIQQTFTIYATAWYRMDPEPGFTRLPRP